MNLLTSSLSTSFSVPSSPSWAHGGMETDATISDETDKLAGNVKSYGDNSYSPYFFYINHSLLVLLSFIILFPPLSVVLEHLDHFLVATHELATSVQHSGVRETAFHHDLS